MCMVTAFTPLDAIVVPLYSVCRALGLRLDVPGAVPSLAFSLFDIFLVRQAILDVPRDFDEAAVLDGATTFRVFWSAILPNVRPALITLVLVQFMWSWNSFVWPLVAMQDPTKQVVQVTIAKFQSVQNFACTARCSRPRRRQHSCSLLPSR